MSSQFIPLFYWSEIKFILRKKENYGDLLSKYLVEKISGRPIQFIHPKKQPWYKFDKKNYLAIGSIIHHASKESIVWGSGIIDRIHKIAPADFRAVRGPRSREYLLDLGYNCPDIYGDPALLLPKYFKPKVIKKYKFGVIPHYHDFEKAKQIFIDNVDVIVIDILTLDVEDVTSQILSCEKTISSSLHGIIVSHAYEIPSIWVEFSDKIFGDGIKYRDYLESVNIPYYKAEFLDSKINMKRIENLLEKYPNLPSCQRVKSLQAGLMEVCPFKDNTIVS